MPVAPLLGPVLILVAAISAPMGGTAACPLSPLAANAVRPVEDGLRPVAIRPLSGAKGIRNARPLSKTPRLAVANRPRRTVVVMAAVLVDGPLSRLLRPEVALSVCAVVARPRQRQRSVFVSGLRPRFLLID